MTCGESPEHRVALRLVRRSDPGVTGASGMELRPSHDQPGLLSGIAGAAGRRQEVVVDTMAPDRERESLALAIMIDELSRDPGNLLQRLVEVVTGVCGVGTAAVAVTNGSAVGWDAAAGPLAHTPRLTALQRAPGVGWAIERLRPLGAGVDQATSADPAPIVDAQTIPLLHDGSMVGVLWIADHEGGAISADDERVVRTLAQLAASAWTLWSRGQASRRASQRKGERLARVAHELRYPTGTLATAAAVLRDRAPLGAEEADAVEIIDRECRHLAGVVTDLLDNATLDEPALLPPVVSSTAAASQPPATRRRDDATIMTASIATSRLPAGEVTP
jgi:signal transduction histidine kinase